MTKSAGNVIHNIIIFPIKIKINGYFLLQINLFVNRFYRTKDH
jgi:hypothetical protein